MKSVRFAPLLLLFPAPAAITAADADAANPVAVTSPATRAESAEIAALRAKAEHGNAIAQYNLGLAYAQGREVSADPIEAFVWLTLAAEGGSTGKALETVLNNVSEAQLGEGRRRLEAVRASNPFLRLT